MIEVMHNAVIVSSKRLRNTVNGNGRFELEVRHDGETYRLRTKPDGSVAYDVEDLHNGRWPVVANLTLNGRRHIEKLTPVTA